jgi:hypothetical protein
VNSLRKAFDRAVYFHAVGGPLTHNAGCLIEGCLALDIPVKICAPEITSRPVSRPLKGIDLKPLISQPFAGFAGYIVDITHTNTLAPFEGIQNGRLAYLNQSDVGLFSRMPDPHLMFIAHETRPATKGGARVPIAFGMNEDLISATEARKPFKQRSPRALRNFRATMNQSLRAMLDLTYVPQLARHLPIDRAVYGPGAYLQALLDAPVCLAYGGDFYSPIMENAWFAQHQPAVAEMHRFERFDAPAIVMRWDSWRLWESFTAGCVTVHLDFAKYGFALPEMPEPWVHYAPIDLDDIAASVEQLMDRQRDWESIAERGRAWAIAHYAPKPTTLRVLNEMLQRAPRITAS